eukprot:TRINITY_DN92_c1_g1_i3.p1 TRINITY_DN92_c1_g1~~TRINITY_DN92_c1_g1_i3.p1  ORF type:complete len:217 (-),score=46.83 TRINITY_DN92_c1_g1_i3:59-709(-)
MDDDSHNTQQPPSTKLSEGETTARVRPLVLAGPSGAGKSTLIKRVTDQWPAAFEVAVSHTTRAPRPLEKDKVHYHFTNVEEFNKLKQEGGFIETTVFAKNHYGTPKQAVRDMVATGKIYVLDIDIQGVLSVKQTDLHPHYVFIVPPSIEELERRLRNRGDTAPEAIEDRLNTARKELEYRDRRDFWDLVVVNDDLDHADALLRAWLQEHYPTLSSN